jgi:replicative DNA helicase
VIADWAGKLAGGIGRIAGLLHLVAAPGRERLDEPVSAQTMEDALRIGRYLLSHAVAAFEEMGADPATEGAKAILVWLRRTGKRAFSRRDAHQALRGGGRFRRATDLDEPLRLLAECCFIRGIDIAPDGSGRPRSSCYEVNPRASKSSTSSKSPFIGRWF